MRRKEAVVEFLSGGASGKILPDLSLLASLSFLLQQRTILLVDCQLGASLIPGPSCIPYQVDSSFKPRELYTLLAYLTCVSLLCMAERLTLCWADILLLRQTPERNSKAEKDFFYSMISVHGSLVPWLWARCKKKKKNTLEQGNQEVWRSNRKDQG